ncbi:MAG: sulfotransferase [Candidatus Wallbacteria bacterium]|nr:sulfotransferase [Candidatus Wallbacteria bacterium]
MSPGGRSPGPVFIIGTERSGSNLLRLMLDAHSSFAIPHPPHFMRYLAPLAASYGDLSDSENRRRLTTDALLLLRAHIHPWEHPIDLETVVAEASPSVFGVVAAIQEQYREQAGARRWGCKSTFTVHYVDDVVAEYPDARFLWLVRDPRDVAASAKRAVFCRFHPLLTARLWVEEQERAAAALERYGAAQVHLLRYEELVAAPRHRLEQVCAFLGEPFEEAMLQHHVTPAAHRLARLSESWANADRPVNEESVGRHTRALTDRERRLVEQTAGPMMQRLGYRLEAGLPWVEPPSELALHALDFWLWLSVEWRSMRTDRNHWQRWLRDATVLWLRAKAFARVRLGLKL